MRKAKRKVRKKKLVPLSRLKRSADRWWAAAVLAEGARKVPFLGGPSGACLVCLERPAVAAHHIFAKGAHGSLRYDLRNGLPVCHGCHMRERYAPAWMVYKAIGYIGGQFFALGREAERARGSAKVWTRVELVNVLAGLEAVMMVHARGGDGDGVQGTEEAEGKVVH